MATIASIPMVRLNRRMAKTTQVIDAPADEARAWMQYSLEQGFDLSAAVLNGGFLRQGKFLAIVSEAFQRTPVAFRSGGVLGQRVARERLAQILDELSDKDGKAIVVEDSTAERNDPNVSHRGEPSAFLGDRVVHWRDLSDGSTQAMEVVAWGTTGYPTNAFITTRASRDLGLVNLKDAPKNLAEEVASSLLAIAVAAFDAESYLLWVDDVSTMRL